MVVLQQCGVTGLAAFGLLGGLGKKTCKSVFALPQLTIRLELMLTRRIRLFN